ncbi:MAG TPA: hypothetical protein VFU19_21270 [Iamia sp.]|nr:hypothetical protein [Iamia sp.]
MTTTFEDEVRTMLARRAADIADPGAVPPPLPAGLRFALDEGPPGRRPRTLLVAAAVVLLLGAAGLVLRGGDGGTERTGSTDAPAAPAPERSPHLATLPEGIDPTVGPVRGVGPSAPTPEAAADALMAATFGADVTTDAPFGWSDPAPEGLWAAHRTPLVERDPAAWPPGADAEPVASVVARSSAVGWQVVAVVDPALDLRSVAYDGTRLTGEVRSPSSAPLRVVVSTLAGDVLATGSLTTSPDDAGRPSVVLLRDLEVDAGGADVVLRVEAGDRPGQVGLDGVRVAAVSTVVLPGPDGGVSPTGDALWRVPVPDVGEDAAAAARTYVEDVLDVPVAGTRGPEPAERGTVSVTVDLVDGVAVAVGLEREAAAWAIVEVGGGRVERADDGTVISSSWRGLDIAGRDEDVDGPLFDTRNLLTLPTGEIAEVGDRPDPSLLRAAVAALVIALDPDDGRVIGMTGNPL